MTGLRRVRGNAQAVDKSGDEVFRVVPDHLGDDINDIIQGNGRS